MFDSLKEKMAQYSLKKMVQKGVVMGAKAGAALIVANVPAVHNYAMANAPFIVDALSQFQVSVTLDPSTVEQALVIIGTGIIGMAHNAVKRIGPAWLTRWI